MIEGIVSFFRKNKRSIAFASILIFAFFIDFDISLAAEKSPGEQAVEVTNAIMKVVAGIMGIMTAFVTLFLQPDWVNGTYIDLDIYMRAIWILVSNVVYVIFAFLLIVIAFANIIGKGQEKFGLKQALPKFIIGILMVPTSWFMVQFLISLSGVLTVAALSLPYDTFKDRADDFPVFALTSDDTTRQPLSQAKICTEYVIHFGETPQVIPNGNFQGSLAAAQASASQNRKDPIYCKQTDAEKPAIIQILRGDQIGGQESIYSIIALYTFGLLGLESIDNVEATHVADGGVTSIVAFLTKNIVNLVFILIFFLLLIALFFALFMRVLRIWIYTMLSPLFGLMFFFGKLGSGGEGLAGRFNIREFIALVMTPVYVSLALSFGFMFMLVAGNGLQNKTQAPADAEVVPIRIGIIEINITGAVNDSGDQQNAGTANHIGAALRSFKGLGGAMGEIVVLLFGIGMLWLAVMAALKQSEITKAAVAPIEAFGNQVGKLAASAPQYMPIIPTGKGMTSAAGLKVMGSNVQASVRDIGLDHSKELGKKFSFLPGSEASEVTDASKRAYNTINSRATLDRDGVAALKEATFTASNSDNLYNNESYVKTLNEALKKAGFDTEVNRGDRQAMISAIESLDGWAEKNTSVGDILGRTSNDKMGTLDNNRFNKQLSEQSKGSDVDRADDSKKVKTDQTTTQEVTRITQGVDVTNVNNITSTGDELKLDVRNNGEIKELISGLNNNLIQEDRDPKVVRAELKKAGIKKEILDVVMSELDDAVVFKGEK